MKIHLTYRVNGAVTGAAMCGNNYRHYKYGLPVRLPIEFRLTEANKRCKHCEIKYMEQRNKIRRKKGKPPVNHPFDGQVSG